MPINWSKVEQGTPVVVTMKNGETFKGTFIKEDIDSECICCKIIFSEFMYNKDQVSLSDHTPSDNPWDDFPDVFIDIDAPELTPELDRHIKILNEQIENLKVDKARLDWLENWEKSRLGFGRRWRYSPPMDWDHNGFDNIREAIDAAMNLKK